ncbi:MAG: paraquat-inducible protein A [Verrucomicrobiales bacterium]|nr:paraquat-inducible protein A [Verrucomicrobiales bacterium]
MKTYLTTSLLVASLTCFIMGLASPLLSVSSRVVVGLGKFEFPLVDIAETMSIPQTVVRLGQDGEFLLMLVVLLSCILFPALKLVLLGFQALGRGTAKLKILGRFLERWSFLELLVLAVFLTILKADNHLKVEASDAVGWLLAAILTAAVAHWLIQKSNGSLRGHPGLAALLALCLPSCERPSYEHHVKLEKLGGVAVGSSVIWKGAEIGSVTAIGPEDGKLKATMCLHPAFAGALRQGVVAEVPAIALPAVRGRVTLVGGDDPSSPVLASGTELPVKPVSLVRETISLAKDYANEAATAVLSGIEAGAENLRDELPERLDGVTDAAADSLDALSEKLRR